MSIYENGCRWYFAAVEDNAGDEGPNSAMSQTFSQFPCSALVRESIQNSLDAVVDESTPVKVCFEYRTFERTDYPNFFKLEDHIRACLENYNDNPTATRVYPRMIQYLKNAKEVGFIRVSDYNTKGMDYSQNATNKTFYAFVRAAGVSVKQAQGAGGSFGFGKGAFFVMSPINTLMVSTKNIHDECFFEGVTRLCSHWEDGKKRSHMGFYDNNNGQPTSDSDRIPRPFKREETGTSIGIMGVKQEEWDNSKDELIKEVLRNFFVAVLKGKLVVIVNGNKPTDNDAVTIDASHLDELMKSHFPDLRDARTKTAYNPRPYYEAIKNEKMHEADLSTLGHVYAYFKEVPENATSVIYMRKLYMKVNKVSRSLGNFNGVFICDNENGNTILGDMENPEHNEWVPENCNKEDRATSFQDAKLAKQEFDKFLTDCFNELLELDSTESVQVADLEKYLPNDSGAKGKGEKGNPFYGTPTGKYTEKEGTSRTTEGEVKPYDPNKKSREKGNVKVIVGGTFTPDPKGGTTGGTGGDGPSGGGGEPGPGDTFGPGTITGPDGRHKELVPVEWRPIISKKKGYMDIVIYVEHDVDDAELSFKIGREQSAKKEDVAITWCSKGTADGLNITGVNLKRNAKNIIQVAFSDNMSHTLTLGVYEII